MKVYLAARDLAGVPIGTHQFIIIELSTNPYPVARIYDKDVKARSLGLGKIGYVIGAQNRGNLSAEYFEASDYQATLEYYDPKRVSFFKSDFDTQVSEVSFGRVSVQDGVRKILNLVEFYSINQETDKIKYPTAGLGYNSNSWAQSVIKYSGGQAIQDFDGLDVGRNKVIPETYFMPVCTLEPRPVLNE